MIEHYQFSNVLFWGTLWSDKAVWWELVKPWQNLVQESKRWDDGFERILMFDSLLTNYIFGEKLSRKTSETTNVNPLIDHQFWESVSPNWNGYSCFFFFSVYPLTVAKMSISRQDYQQGGLRFRYPCMQDYLAAQCAWLHLLEGKGLPCWLIQERWDIRLSSGREIGGEVEHLKWCMYDVYNCIYIYIYTYIHTYIYIYIHIYI